jgi:tetratricopeptide (TPR) repeat protein
MEIKVLIKQAKNIIFWSLAGWMAVGCATNRNNPINAAWHDFTAHFNAHFIAREHIDAVETAIQEDYEWNYNEILPIYPPYDSTDAVGFDDQLQDAIKKASISIQFHPGSKFEYPCYILVGKARLYTLEFPEAIETFKYVNTKCENDDVRHEALIHLMRAYTLNNEYKNAQAVVDYLAKEDLSNANQSLYHLNQAYLYQVTGDLNKMVQNLAQAEKLGAHNHNRSRTQFIIGQVYQQLGFDGLAFDYYKRLLRNNPSYELSFYTKLNMAQVTELTEGKDVKTIRKYFTKLIRDRKNEEYLDKIYYEMGTFEQKNGNLDLAITDYQTSVRKSVNNNRQKGLSYLSLAKIHYDSMKNFELAKSYYDSTVNTLPQDDPNYEAIKTRQEVLTEFVKHITTLRTNDSLIALSQLPKDSIRRLARSIVEKDSVQAAQKRIAEEKRNQQQARLQQNRDLLGQGDLISTGSSESSWYFDNPTTVSRGFVNFQRNWDERPLADNWRRSQRVDRNAVTAASPSADSSPGNEAGTPEIGDASNASKIDEMIARVPQSEAQISQLNQEMLVALYELGKIYNFKLYETDNAIRTFENLIVRFPGSEYEAEVLYQLFLIQKDIQPQASQRAADRLLNDYPETIYAKLVVNPNYREESFAVTQKLKQIYESAYALYKKGQYQASLLRLDSALSLHPDNEFSDHLALLKAINIGESEGESRYQYELNAFLISYPTSELLPYARTLIRKAEAFQTERYSSSKANFISSYDGPHHFVLAYAISADNSKIAIDLFKAFTAEQEELSFGNVVLSTEYGMAMIRDVPSREAAQDLLTKFTENTDLQKAFVGQKHYIFVISDDNFDMLYSTKDLPAYINFYKNHYQ